MIFILIFGSPGKQGGTGKIRRKGAGAFPEKLRREVVFRHWPPTEGGRRDC
ncbi:hypothetical protein B4135_1945 [Caldibacillus debilis]|uniref:Uncharacterized protein n=1 Tax=Caldibacillus debilis TaxID=301148 RepID=A0A150M7T6_9BACI|nr:hypothetical protein B4135_1945 [Caldibacillus debilis]